MTDELVLRCPRHPEYTGEGEPPPMASHTQYCAACDRLRQITELKRRAEKADNWLERQLCLAKAETMTWAEWKRKAIASATNDGPDEA